MTCSGVLFKRNLSSGIALIAVMAALMVLSAIALGLAASVQTEARIDAADWDSLQAEQLARSGQEFATFLEARGLRKTPDFMAGLPFDAVTPGFHYRAQLPTGSVDMYFEADSGKLDLTTAPDEVLTNFFTWWTGDFTKAQLISAAIEDWRDPDNDVRRNGAEASSYVDFGYAPRNGALGLADAPLIQGISGEDFQARPIIQGGIPVLRNTLDDYFTAAGLANKTNPNFAPEAVLRSIPGINESQVETILLQRREHLFDDLSDFQSRIGLPSTSIALRYLNFSRSLPAISSVSQLKVGAITRSERRVMYSFNLFNPALGVTEPKSALGRIQRSGGPTLPNN